MISFRLRHEYALDKNGTKIYPEKAEYNINYFDSRKNELILKAKNSKYKRPHFSYKHDIDFLNVSESNTVHTAAIDYIKKQGYVIVNDVKYLPHNIIIEKATIEDSRLIPDLTFYDENNNILCLIEVACTHKCEENKIKILEEKNILTIELDYDEDYKNFTGYRRFGFKPNEREVKEINEHTDRLKNSNRKYRTRIQEGTSIIKKIRIKKQQRFIVGFSNFNEHQQKEFDNIRKRIDNTKTEIKNIQLEIQKEEQFLRFKTIETRVRNAKDKIQTIESNPFSFYN